MVRAVLQAHITDITMINIVGLDIVANAEDSVIRDVEETIIDLNLTKSVKPHVQTVQNMYGKGGVESLQGRVTAARS